MADDKTTQQATPEKDMNRNPKGKGGFGDNPQNRNPGGWKPEMVFSYQYRRFMNMTIDELEKWAKTPKSKRTVVEDLAYTRVLTARASLPDVREITDRTEGKAPQSIDLTTGGDKIQPATIVDLGNVPNIDQAESASPSDQEQA